MLSLLNNVLLRTRRALSPYRVYGDGTLLVLNGTSLNNVNALLALSRRYVLFPSVMVLPSSFILLFSSQLSVLK